MAKTRRKYNEDFKTEAVRLMEQRANRTVHEVAIELGVTAKQLHNWRARMRNKGNLPERHMEESPSPGFAERFGSFERSAKS